MKPAIFTATIALASFLIQPLYARDALTRLTVTTASMVKTTLPRTVEAYGTIDSAPDRMAAVSLPYGGQIVRLVVTVGRHVKRNDALAEIKPDPAVALAFRQAQTALTLAQGELARTRRLVAEHLATTSQLAAARKAAEDAGAAVQSLQQAGGGLDSVVIRAPFDATVTAIATGKGDRIAANTTILDLASASGIVASLGIEPVASRTLKSGQSVTLSVLEEPLTLKGSVENIGTAIEPKSGLVIAALHVASDGAIAVYPGEHVRGVIETDNVETWAVPRDAVLSDSAGAYLFQIVDGKAKRVAVHVGPETATQTGVEGAFDPALPVIVQGSYEAADGMAVTIAPKP